MHRTASNKTTLVSELFNIFNEENVIIASGQGKTLVSILSDESCEEQAFPRLPPRVNLDIMQLKMSQQALLGTLTKKLAEFQSVFCIRCR